MGTPLTTTMIKSGVDVDCAVQASPSSQQTSPSGHESPGVCVPPAEAGRESAANSIAHTKTNDSFLISDSPCVEVVDKSGRVPTKTGQYTPNPDPDLVLFLTFASRNDFDSLTTLCLERLATTRDDRQTLRWRKDHAIALSLQGKFSEAFKVLKNADWLASRVEGVVRGKYENEFGMVLIEHFGRPALALDRFNLGIEHVIRDGSVKVAFDIEHNIGRAYAAQGEHVKASEYFTRALDFARASDDHRLEMEVCESILEFTEGAKLG